MKQLSVKRQITEEVNPAIIWSWYVGKQGI